MNTIPIDWIFGGTGRTPGLAWVHTLETPPLELKVSYESGDILSGDAAGLLSRIDSSGQVMVQSQEYGPLVGFDVHDRGGIAILKTGKVKTFDQTLKQQSSFLIGENAMAVACDPFGHFFALGFGDGRLAIFGQDGDLQGEFKAPQPVRWIRFLVDEPGLVASSNYGWVARLDLHGAEVWRDWPASNIGGLATSGNGGRNFLAAHNHGVLRYNQKGQSRPPIDGKGTVVLVCTNYDGERLGQYTLEGDLLWGDETGMINWRTNIEEELVAIASDPIGLRLIAASKNGHIFCLQWDK